MACRLGQLTLVISSYCPIVPSSRRLALTFAPFIPTRRYFYHKPLFFTVPEIVARIYRR